MQKSFFSQSDGFSTGLRFWLFFMLGFALLGYSSPVSILLGAAGGFSGKILMDWWEAKDDPKNQQEVEQLQKRNPDLSNARIKRVAKARPGRRFRRGGNDRPDWMFWRRP
ncbi:MAG: hypothetical protein H0X31_13480 [Nostocaceae cyanobacterium]|nr:hypothetical protein [Nostocaceae cyanobacterium]